MRPKFDDVELYTVSGSDKTGMWVVNQDYKKLYVNFIVKAQSTAAVGGWALDVTQTGRFFVERV